MKKIEEGNIKFIKQSGVVFALSLLGLIGYFILSASHSSGGGSIGGGLSVIGLVIVVVVIILVVLNYFFSKPNEKFLLFMPLLILIYFYELIGMRLTISLFERLFRDFEGVKLVLRFVPSIILIITEIFLIKYILSKSKLSTSKKYFLLLPALIFVARYIVKLVLMAFIFV